LSALRRTASASSSIKGIDITQQVEVRKQALRIIRSTSIDEAQFESIARLAQDPQPEVAVAALELFHYLARAPEDDFDQRVLIPTLTQAMSDPDPKVREAAYGALSTISVHRPAYLRAADFPALLETGAKDPEPRVRVVALVSLLGDARSTKQRDAIVERGLTDPDPYVRRMAVSWLGSPRTKTRSRQDLIAQALGDPDPDVRATAVAAQQQWDSRKRSWPIDLWRLVREGEYGKVGMRILVAVTVATPILICGIFLLYYMARLLTLLQQRRWRAAAVVPVIAAWVGASYGVDMLFFLAAHVGDADGGEIAIVAGILWGAIAIYALVGWGLHYVVRN
jgi:HEAT repeat protein